MKNITKYLCSILLTIFVIVIAMVFYAPMFAYQEGMSIFMTGWDFFAETCFRPGGFSDYLGCLLVQFFMYPIGLTVVLTVCIVGVQLMTKNIFIKHVDKNIADIMSVVCAMAMVVTTVNPNTVFGGIVAILLSIMSVMLFSRINNISIVTAVVPIVYWISGGWCCLIYIIGITTNFCRTKKYIFLSISSLLLILTWLLTKKLTQENSLIDTFVGVIYRRYATVENWLWYGVIAIVCGNLLLSVIKIELKNRITILSLYTITSFLSIGFMYKTYDKGAMLNYKTDRMVRLKQWSKIVETIKKSDYSMMMSQCYLNVALNELGILENRMFNFAQKGTEGLMSGNIDGFDKSVCNSEIYFRLGLMNIAERLAIDAMESNDTHQKSARHYKRLAEVNIIRHNKPLAMRYLKKLQRTFFYSAWANRAIDYLNNPEQTEALADWKIKPLEMEKDIFLSENYQSEMLLAILLNNPENRKVFNYYMCSLLLSKDLGQMHRFLAKISPAGELGIHIYEATLLYLFNHDRVEFEKLMSNKNEMTMRFDQFGKFMSSSNAQNAAKAKELFGNTYWFYYYFE